MTVAELPHLLLGKGVLSEEDSCTLDWLTKQCLTNPQEHYGPPLLNSPDVVLSVGSHQESIHNTTGLNNLVCRRDLNIRAPCISRFFPSKYVCSSSAKRSQRDLLISFQNTRK